MPVRYSFQPSAVSYQFIKPKHHTELAQRARGLKRMLTALLQKLTAER